MQRRASSQRAAPQRPVSRPPHSLPPTGAYPSTGLVWSAACVAVGGWGWGRGSAHTHPPTLHSGASSSLFEGTLSFPDGPFSSPHSVLQEPLSSNSSTISQRYPSNPSSLALPQQALEGRLGPHLPGGGGRDDSGPIQGAGSLVQQPTEEQGGPVEGDVLRGPDQGMYVRAGHN